MAARDELRQFEGLGRSVGLDSRTFIARLILLVAFMAAGSRDLGAGPLFLAPFLSLDAGNNPTSVAIGDLNGDGRPDLAVANSKLNESSVSVLLGNGDGSFRPKTDYEAGNEASSVAIGDLNGDGRADLAVANATFGTVSVLLGNGDGTFGSKTDYEAGTGASCVAIGDLNGDGRPDLAVANRFPGTVSVLPGNGDGTFRSKTDYEAGNEASSVAIGDLNGDGKPDLAVANSGTTTISVFTGTGDGTFTPKADYGAGTHPHSVTIADLNGDGKPDLVAANLNSQTVSVLIGNGKGTFATKADYSTGFAEAVTVGDLNGDGKPDLVVANSGVFSTVAVLSGNGDGSFAPARYHGAGNQCFYVAIGDLNNDGMQDLAVANYGSNTISVCLGNGDGTFGSTNDYGTGRGPTFVAIDDLNADGETDLVVVNDLYGENSVSVLTGNGDGTFRARHDFATGNSPETEAIADLDGDGNEDIAVANSSDTTISLLLGNGDGSFRSKTDIAVGGFPHCVAIGDLNGDGKLDVAVAITYAVSVLLGHGDGTFEPYSKYGTSGLVGVVAVGELNGDDAQDLVSVGDSVWVWVGTDNGPLERKSEYGISGSTMALGDLNGDGKEDLALANTYASNTISVCLGHGDGTFGTRTDYGIGMSPSSIAVGDLNGDGKADMAVAIAGANAVSVLMGIGDGTFGSKSEYGTGLDPRGVTIGDLSGDGEPDLAVSNRGTSTISVLLNSSHLGPSTGALTNVVSDTALVPLTAARVTAFSDSGGFASSLTDAQGKCTLRGLVPGAWTIAATAGSYQGQSQSVTVTAATTTTAGSVLGRDPCGAWTSRTSMPTRRSAAAAVPVALQVYVLGGANTTGELCTNESYDAVGGTWSSHAPMTTKRAGFAAGSLGGYIYAVGGIHDNTAVATTERYDPTNNTWAAAGTVPDMPHPGWGLPGVVLDGKFWVVGGYSPTEHDMHWLRSYNASTNSWSLLADMPTARSWHAAAGLDGKLFAIGGWNGGTLSALRSVDIYDPGTNTWSAGPAMPLPLKDVSAVSDGANKRILVIGGTTGDGKLGTEVTYQVTLQLKQTGGAYQWTFLSGYPTSGAGAAAAVVSGQLFGFGGRSTPGPPYSAQASMLTPTSLPAPPTGLKAENLGTGTSLKLTWNAVPGATGYGIQRSDGFGRSQTGTEYVDTGLTRGTTYTYTLSAVNPCGVGPPSASVSRAPDYYPVLLVHGICGTWRDFTDADPNCFPTDGDLSKYRSCLHVTATRLGDLLAAPPLEIRTYVALYDLNARLFSDVPAIAAAIDQVRTATGEDKVTLVAHSQGGLISRSLLQTRPEYRERVANLIMIGTPNHGTALANASVLSQPLFALVLTPLKCLTTTSAKYDLVPGCAFLNQLNYGGDRSKYDRWRMGGHGTHAPEDIQSETEGGEVSEWTVMGTGGWCGFGGSKLGFYFGGLIGAWPNDGAVANESTRLTALANDRQWTDTQLDPDGNFPRATHFSRSEGSCNREELRNDAVLNAVVDILTNGGPLHGSGTTNSSATVTRAAMGRSVSVSTQPDTAAWFLLPPRQGSIEGAVTRSDSVQVDQVNAVSFLQVGDVSSGLTLNLRSPSGMQMTISDTLTGAVTYERDPGGAYQALVVPTPESGAWTVLSGLPTGAPSQQIYVLPAVSSGTGLSIEIDPGAPQLGSPLTITAALDVNSAAVPGVMLTGDVTRPDSSLATLSFYDDGAHGDGAAGDGIFGAIFTPMSSGSYALEVVGTSGSLQRESFAGFVVEELPDPAVLPADIRIIRQGVPGGVDTLSISATVRNLGPVDAGNALVAMRDGLGTRLLSTSLTIPAGGEALIPSVQWIPGNPDTATLVVTVDPNFNFIESRLDNDTAIVYINPGNVSVSPARLPDAIILAQNIPNPSHGQTMIQFSLPRVSTVSLRVYDVAGREVRRLLDGLVSAGIHSAAWDGLGAAGGPARAGIYFYELRANGERLVRKAVLLR